MDPIGTPRPEPSPEPPTPTRPWLARVFLAHLLVAMIAFSVAPVLNCVRGKVFNKDYSLWYQIGRMAARGDAIYPKDGRPFPFMYPPPAAAMLGVLSKLGYTPMVVALLLVNSAAWALCLMLAVKLATGRATGQHPLLYLLPALATGVYVHDIFLLGQPNLLLLACMLGSFICLRTRRDGWAGALIAFAAAVKAFPILAVGYLVYRRRWKATAATVVTLSAFLLLAPIPFRGPSRAWDDLQTWTRGMVLKYDAGSIAQRPERSYSFKNQSLVATANRLLRSIPADGETSQSWKVNLASLDFHGVNLVILLASATLCGFYLVCMPDRRRRTSATDATEQAMLLLMILFFSPLAFNYFFVWLLYPLTIATKCVLDAPPRSPLKAIRMTWLAATLVILALPIGLPKVAQAYGNEFVAALSLLLGLGFALRADVRSSLGRNVIPKSSPSRAVSRAA